MVDLPVWGINDPSGAYKLTASDFRKGILGGLLAHDTSMIAARPGVLDGVAATASGRDVITSSGHAVVNAGGQSYAIAIDQTTITADPPDASLDRWDLLCLRVLDPEVDGGAVRAGRLELIKGSPSGAPTYPSAPAGSLSLWGVRMLKSDQIVLADLRTSTALGSSVIVCTSTSRPETGAMRVGQMIFESDTQALQFWSGSAWVLLTASSGSNANGTWTKFADGTMICGFTGQLSIPALSTYGSLFQSGVNWTFPQPFATPPAVAVGQAQISTGASWASIGGAPGTTSVNIRVMDAYQRGASTAYCTIIAYGRWR